MIIYFRMFFSFCLIIISPLLSVAQRSDTYFSSQKWLKIKAYSITEGLPSKSTTATFQDKRGFIWIGTQNGLCRFDGFEFKIFSSSTKEETTISNNYINAICEDKQGNIWVATMDGLNLFDPLNETFERFYHHASKPSSLSNNKVWSLLCDHYGTVWIGTDDGFNRYLPNKKAFFVYKPDAAKKGSIQGKSVNAIIEDRQHDLWLGTWSAGLNKFIRKNSQFINFPQRHLTGKKNPNDVWSLSLAADGSIWVGSYWDGLFNFNIKTEKFSRIESPGGKSMSVFSILPVNSSSLLICSSSGTHLYDLSSKYWTRIGQIQTFDNSRALQDKEGHFWINAVDGVYLIRDHRYKFNLQPLPLLSAGVSSIISRENIIWIGTSQGLIRIDKKNGQKKIFRKDSGANSLTNDNITKLYYDSRGLLWILTEHGFDSFNEKTKQFNHYSHSSSLGNLFNEDVFRDILEIEKDVYMLATDAGIKVFHLKTLRFEHYYNQPGRPASINNNHTYKLAKAPDGKIWIGTYGGGINILDRKSNSFSQLNPGKGLGGNVINDILVDTKKNIWLTTPDGLYKYDVNQQLLRTYSKNDGFAGNIFKDIEQDGNGLLWMITENGVSSLNPTSQMVRNFDETDGFIVNSVLTREGDSIYIAGNKGYFSFKSGQMRPANTHPRVYLTDFQILNEPVLPNKSGPLKENISIAREINIDYNQSIFALQYVAPEYTNPSRIKYAYRLTGFDSRWNNVDQQRKATYTNLNPGLYRFEVKAYYADGAGESPVTYIMIRIHPPWYLTWWSYLIYTLILLQIGYLYYRYRKNQGRLKFEIQLARIQSEKEKELNERKSAFFINISHEFRTPLTLIINPVKDLMLQNAAGKGIHSLDIVYRNARRLLMLVDQLISHNKAETQQERLNVSKIDIIGFSKEIFHLFDHQAAANLIAYDFSASESLSVILADREKLGIVIFNLLSNAFKFTPKSGAISLSLEQSAEKIIIKIKDSGSGITEAAQGKIFDRFYQHPADSRPFAGGFGIGLYLVKTFIELHNGSVYCASEPGKGATFLLELPKADGRINASFDPAQHEENEEKMLQSEPYERLKSTADVNDLSVDRLKTDRKTILIIDDNEELASYLGHIFSEQYHILQAWNGESGLAMIYELLPDIVISDVMMGKLGGIELCRIVKQDELISHIPIVLLTASNDQEVKFKAIENGADDFINKPFDNNLLIARIANILKSKNSLQRYFYNEITLNLNHSKISLAYQEFLRNCIEVVERHMEDPEFSIKVLAEELGMSRENLFKKIKSISGHSSNSFIRFIRLRRAAEIFITTDNTVRETMFIVGISDLKYFREQFRKVFGMNPSEYIKKYRKVFSNNHSLNKDLKREG